MSRCRATSFYAAPGQLRYFADHTVAARHPRTGAFVAFTHRRDIEQFTAAHPDWDGCASSAHQEVSTICTTPSSLPQNRWNVGALMPGW